MRFRRHAACLLGPAVALVLLSFATGALAGRVASSVAGAVALGVGVVVLVWRLVLVPFVRWGTTSYVVTPSRVSRSEGVLRRDRRDVPVARIADVLVRQHAWQRVVGAGTLWVVPEGGSEPLELAGVPQVHRLHDALVEAAGRAAGPEAGRVADPVRR